MEYKSYLLDRTGSYRAHQVDVFDDNTLKFSVRYKLTDTELTDTEMTIAKNKGCISNDEEGLKKLAIYTTQRAHEIGETKKYKDGELLESYFSPCWD